MEKDDYIKVPKKALKYKGKGIVAYNYEWLKEHFDIERKAILGDSEPCDVISREEAIDACNQSVNILEATDRIKDLSPVYPKAKVGKWIMNYKSFDGIVKQYYCSECNRLVMYYDYKDEFSLIEKYPYCHCGAKMEGVQE